MNIKRIKARNIFSYEKIDVELSKFNVLIGSNASGKTNFVKILQFIRDIASEGLTNAISIHGGISYLRNLNIEGKKNILIEFEMEEEFENTELFKFHTDISDDDFFGIRIKNFSYMLSLENVRKEDWKISEENIKATLKIYRIKEMSKSSETGLKGQVEVEFKNNKYIFQIPESISQEVKQYLKYSFQPKYMDNDENNKSILEHDQIPKVFESIRKQLEDIFLFKINTDLVRIWKKRHGRSELDNDGQNLPLILDKILNDNEKRDEFLLIIKDLLPFVIDFFVEERSKDMIELFFREEYTKQKYKLPIYLLSDGTIDITAFIILIFFEFKRLIILEEPFSNVHPHLISKLVNMMKDTDKQIIITTHNPEILKYSGIENVLLVMRDDGGFSNISKPNEIDEIKTFLKNNLRIEDLFEENLF